MNYLRRVLFFLAIMLTACTNDSDPYQAYNDAARKDFSILAEQGDSDALTYLAVIYQIGLGIEKDYLKAAMQGHAPAQYNLGLMYQRGTGIEKDDAKAYQLFSSAAEQSHRRHKYNWAIWLVMEKARKYN